MARKWKAVPKYLLVHPTACTCRPTVACGYELLTHGIVQVDRTRAVNTTSAVRVIGHSQAPPARDGEPKLKQTAGGVVESLINRARGASSNRDSGSDESKQAAPKHEIDPSSPHSPGKTCLFLGLGTLHACQQQARRHGSLRVGHVAQACKWMYWSTAWII